MGGSFGISLESGNNPVFAGSHLKGFIFVGMTKTVKATDVSLQFTGMEKTRVTLRGRTTYGTRPIVRASLSMAQSTHLKFKDGFILPGNYKLPFAIELPTSLPSTTQINDGDNFSKTEYDLTAALVGGGDLSHYSFEKRLLLKAFPHSPRRAIPFQSAPIKQDLTFMSCYDRGSLSFGVRIDDLRVQRGENLVLKMTCRNVSNVRVLKFSGHLFEINHWTSGNETVTTKNRLQRIIIDDIPGMEPTKKVSKMRTDDDIRRDLSNMFRELETGKFRETLRIPLKAHASYEGILLKIEHVLTLRLATDCFYEDHVVSIPLQICEAVTKVKTSGVVGTKDFEAGTVVVPKRELQLGGTAHESSVDVAPPIPLGAPLLQPSLTSLVQAMEYAVADLDAVQIKAMDEAWHGVFSHITPHDFSTILNAVRTPFDVPEVAEALALAMRNHFTCKHISTAFPVIPDWNLAHFVEKLLPYCNDLAANKSLLMESLTYWERLLTEKAFTDHVRKS